jgi:predicted metal-dependent enzyme (double-stranded beta helix superfamily)
MSPLATIATTAPTGTRSLAGELLRDIAAGVATARTLWEPRVRHDPNGRSPLRLLATDAYEVWAIGWAPGQRAELHDHGDAAGHVVVVEGVLTEHEVIDDGTTRRLLRREIPRGTGRALPVGLVHEVGNHGVERATSIHVYAPPLRAMTHYDPVTLTPTVTELIQPEPPAIGAPIGSVLRHPSVRD